MKEVMNAIISMILIQNATVNCSREQQNEGSHETSAETILFAEESDCKSVEPSLTCIAGSISNMNLKIVERDLSGLFVPKQGGVSFELAQGQEFFAKFPIFALDQEPNQRHILEKVDRYNPEQNRFSSQNSTEPFSENFTIRLDGPTKYEKRIARDDRFQMVGLKNGRYTLVLNKIYEATFRQGATRKKICLSVDYYRDDLELTQSTLQINIASISEFLYYFREDHDCYAFKPLPLPSRPVVVSPGTIETVQSEEVSPQNTVQNKTQGTQNRISDKASETMPTPSIPVRSINFEKESQAFCGGGEPSLLPNDEGLYSNWILFNKPGEFAVKKVRLSDLSRDFSRDWKTDLDFYRLCQNDFYSSKILTGWAEDHEFTLWSNCRSAGKEYVEWCEIPTQSSMYPARKCERFLSQGLIPWAPIIDKKQAKFSKSGLWEISHSPVKYQKYAGSDGTLYSLDQTIFTVSNPKSKCQIQGDFKSTGFYPMNENQIVHYDGRNLNLVDLTKCIVAEGYQIRPIAGSFYDRQPVIIPNKSSLVIVGTFNDTVIVEVLDMENKGKTTALGQSKVQKADQNYDVLPYLNGGRLSLIILYRKSNGCFTFQNVFL